MSNDKDASNCADIDPRTLLNRVAQLESKSVDVLLVQVYRSFKQLEINAYNILSVFSYLRTLTTWHCPSLLQHSIDISYSPGRQQQTRRLLLQRVNGTDRRTDTVPFRILCGQCQ